MYFSSDTVWFLIISFPENLSGKENLLCLALCNKGEKSFKQAKHYQVWPPPQPKEKKFLKRAKGGEVYGEHQHKFICKVIKSLSVGKNNFFEGSGNEPHSAMLKGTVLAQGSEGPPQGSRGLCNVGLKTSLPHAQHVLSPLCFLSGPTETYFV